MSVWAQDVSMGASVRLSEEEAIAVIDGLREALRASKAVIAGREAAQDGGPAAGS